MLEPSSSKTITLGKEYDVQLRITLIEALRELGAEVSDKSWGVCGSQEIERLEVAIDGQTLTVEAETNIGLSIAGQTELVRRVAAWVRLKQKSSGLPIGELDDLLRRLDVLEKSGRGPFPYSGCQWVLPSCFASAARGRSQFPQP